MCGVSGERDCSFNSVLGVRCVPVSCQARRVKEADLCPGHMSDIYSY